VNILNQIVSLRKRHFIIFFFLAFYTSFIGAENHPLILNSDKSKTISSQKEGSFSREKIYIHFDRNNYFIGDEIWFKVYLVEARTHTPTAESKVVYVELIDPLNKVVKTRVIHTENGGGAGEFELNAELESGSYTVRAYTNYMRNFDNSFFFTKELYINSYNEFKKNLSAADDDQKVHQDSLPMQNAGKPDLQFFPEGGSMIAGLPAKIGFKALDETGKSIGVSGIVLDHQEKELISFESSHLGMGSFMLVPETSAGLRARIRYEGTEFYYELPAVLETGVIMRVIDRGDSYQINLQSSLKQGVNGLLLVGEQRGTVVCKANLTGSNTKGSVKVPLSTLDDGIVKFTLYDRNNQPLCERLVFAETKKSNPVVGIQSSKNEYEQRELVELELSLTNPSRLPVLASVTVTDMAANSKSDCNFDILTYMLLHSELRGKIENPCYYFSNKGSESKMHLDLLLLTQGWRNYLWNQLNNSKEVNLTYSFETGTDFKGSIRSIHNNDIPAHGDVSLTYKNRHIFGHDESRTFGQGRFLFPGYLFKDSTSIIIQAKKKQVKRKGKQENTDEMNRDFFIVLDSVSSPSILFQPSSETRELEKLKESFKELEDADYLDALYADQPDFVQLEGVEIKVEGKPIVDPYRRNTMRYNQPRFRVDYVKENVVALGDDLLWTFLTRTPGIVKRLDGYYYRGSEIVFFLDGVRFQSAESLNSIINANDVSFIDLLSGTQAINYLSDVAVIVYSKTPDERMAQRNSGPRKGVINFTYPGIYRAKEFYKPLYDQGKGGQIDTDNRMTLHWEPNLRINAGGKATISFYTADPEAKYRVRLEGLTLDGFPVTAESYFEVRN